MAAAAAAAGRDEERDRPLRKPFTYDGNKEQWIEWSIKLKSYVSQINIHMKPAMDAVSEFEAPLRNAQVETREGQELNAKLYRPDDELLLTRHHQEQEWEHAKKHYVRSVLKESIDKRTSKALLSRNPALMRRSSVRHPLFG